MPSPIVRPADPPSARHRRPVAAVLSGLCLAAALGCGEAKPDRIAVYPAAGKITLKGQPTHGAQLTLHPRTSLGEGVPAPRANVDKDGSFKLSTFAGDDGAPEGEYVVTLSWYKLVKQGPDTVAGPNIIPPKYTKPQSSNIIVRIAAGQNDIPPIKL